MSDFRREVRDYIDKHRNEVISNFCFAGKILKSGKVRRKKRNDYIKKDVMARMLEEGGKLLPTADEFYYVDVNWYFPVLAVMNDVNFVWYNVRDNVTCAYIRIKIDGLYSEKNIEKKGIIKSENMTDGSVWKKRVCIIFCNKHFMHIKEFLGCVD